METRSKRCKTVDSPSPPDSSKDINALVAVVGGAHPLLTDLILENMLSYCSSSEQCQARLVCRSWHEASFRVLKKSGPPILLQHFNNNRREQKLMKNAGQQEGKPKLLKDFLKEIHNPWSPPTTPGGRGIIMSGGIQQYNNFNLQLHSTPSRSLLGSFWKATARWLTQLTMRFDCSTLKLLEDVLLCKWTPNVEQLDLTVIPANGFYINNNSSVMSVAAGGTTNNRPKLKFLKIGFSNFYESVHPAFTFPVDWKALFGYYYKLEHFSLGRPLTPLMMSQVEPVLVAIEQLRRENKSKLALKTLNFFGDMERNFKEHDDFWMLGTPPPAHLNPMESLRKAALPLESLSLCHLDEVPEQDVHQLVSTYGSSLKSLSFCKAFLLETSPFSCRTAATPNMMMMINLRSLVLNGYPFKDLTFLKDLPNLRSLNLWSKNFSILPVQPPSENIIKATGLLEAEGGLEFGSVVQFCCNYPEKWTSGEVSKLRKLMPNLTTLELVLHNKTFRSVCKHWPKLEHLTVFYENVGDDGIVGRNWRAKSNNITCLQNLRTFTIDNLETETDLRTQVSILLTKLSLEKGFMKLRRLEKLTFRVHGMNPELRDMLANMMPPSVQVHIKVPPPPDPLFVLLARLINDDDDDDE